MRIARYRSCRAGEFAIWGISLRTVERQGLPVQTMQCHLKPTKRWMGSCLVGDMLCKNPFCGKYLRKARVPSGFCDLDCEIAARRATKCRTCRKWFIPVTPIASYCSEMCRKIGLAEQNKQRNWRRRAELQARKSEQITFQAVFQRDHGICGICRLPIDANLKYPHPMSPSLDHIRPLSGGGSHVLANVQLSHLRCNIRKGSILTRDLFHRDRI